MIRTEQATTTMELGRMASFRKKKPELDMWQKFKINIILVLLEGMII